jgi:hypothetical protein
MRVVDHDPAFWFLLAEGDRLILDVNCAHGVVSYDFAIELNERERDEHAAHGHDYLSQLADQLNYSAPGVRGTASPYKNRNITSNIGPQIVEVINQWRSQQGQHEPR